jgi:hypothetical protein
VDASFALAGAADAKEKATTCRNRHPRAARSMVGIRPTVAACFDYSGSASKDVNAGGRFVHSPYLSGVIVGRLLIGKTGRFIQLFLPNQQGSPVYDRSQPIQRAGAGFTALTGRTA